MKLGEPPLVQVAANTFKEICYNYRDMLMAGIIVAGWDKTNGGQVYTIPLGGMIVRQPIAIGGSGSTFVWGYVDATYKPNMNKEQTVDFVKNTLTLALINTIPPKIKTLCALYTRVYPYNSLFFLI